MTSATFLLIMTVLVGADPETAPAHDFVIDYGMTVEDCMSALEEHKEVYLGNDWVGMHCEESDLPGVGISY